MRIPKMLKNFAMLLPTVCNYSYSISRILYIESWRVVIWNWQRLEGILNRYFSHYARIIQSSSQITLPFQDGSFYFSYSEDEHSSLKILEKPSYCLRKPSTIFPEPSGPFKWVNYLSCRMNVIIGLWVYT